MPQIIVSRRKRAKKKQQKQVRSTGGKRGTVPTVSAIGQAIRTLGGLGGSALGAMAGQPGIGGSLGSSLGGAMSRWLGYGDYSVGSNSIVRNSLKASSSIPMMHNDSQSIVVRHKEFLGEVRGSTNFTVLQSFEINPGNSSTFPWLSGLAVRFQEYKIRGLVFHYVPSSGSSVSSNPALGTVMMQTSYRGSDVAPTNKVELLNEYCSNEAVPSDSFCHPIECDPKENPFNVQYVRSGGVPEGDSRLLYDLGVMHLCVSGQQNTGNVLGDLWCTYEIELKKPMVSSNVTSTVTTASVKTTGSLTTSTLFTGTQVSAGNLAVTALGRSLYFPAGAVGRYLVTLRFISSTGTFGPAALGTVLSFTNCATAEWCPASGSFYDRTDTTGSGLSTMFICAGVLITDPMAVASIMFPVVTFTGALSETQLVITKTG